jgi:hypothetical protein
MNCARARFLLYAYLDRELSGFETEDLSRHLAHCAPCATRGESARSLGRVLRSRLDRSPAPDRLRERLHNGSARPMRPRYPVLAYAAAVLFLLLPLASDVAGPRLRRASSAIHAQVGLGSPRLSLVSNRVLPLVSKIFTGTFVCLNCEPKPETGREDSEPRHEAGFCADNGEVWRLMSVSPEFTRVSLGRTATVEGVAFPQSGFLRAHRVGY